MAHYVVTSAVVGSLAVVSTPIGNLGDLSRRATEVLTSVAFVLAEDTRHSRPLLDALGVTAPVYALHEHNEAQATPGIVARLAAGEHAALVSDAGTPLLSDPGARLVHAVIDAGIPVVPVPGASALLAALVGSGLPAEPFTFLGFLPRKGAERSARLQWLAEVPHTTVLYEAPPRVADTLRDLASQGMGERRVVVARELTKKFEEFRRGTVAVLAAYYEETPPRGEAVLVLEGAPPAPALDESMIAIRAAALVAEGKGAREIMTLLMGEWGLARNAAYRMAQDAVRVARVDEGAL